MATAHLHDPMARLGAQPREVLRVLETVELFADMTTRERSVLAEIAELVKCDRDVQVFGVGEDVRWWYLLLHGQIDESVRAPDGTWPVVRQVLSGQCVGLDSVLSGQPSATQATSVSACALVRIPVMQLHQVLRGSSVVSVKLQVALNAELGRDLRAATEAVIEMSV